MPTLSQRQLLAALSRIRDVWDMDPPLVETAFRLRHLNTYVYAGLLAVKTSAWPRRGRFRLARGRFPGEVEQIVDRLLARLPGPRPTRGSRAARLEVAQCLNELYACTPRLSPAELSDWMTLYAALAFIALQTDRQDEVPLWFHPPVRQLDRSLRQALEVLSQPLGFERLLEGPLAGSLKKRGAQQDNPITVLFCATILLVQAIIVAAENGAPQEQVRSAYLHLEEAMMRYEQEHRLGQHPDMVLNLAGSGQLRYRNTLYLYGGNHLERMAHYDEARHWYLKDIDDPVLPESLGFYLTGLKTTERLLRAFTVTPARERPRLRQLIDRSQIACLGGAKLYARRVLAAREAHPGADWSTVKVQLGEQMLFFGSEATREPLLSALIYRRVIDDIRYADTDYRILEPV